MTPLQLEILVWYYGHGDDYRDGDFRAPAVRDAIDAFHERDGLIRISARSGLCYEITERGKIFVEHLMAQPLPEQQWIMPTRFQQALSGGAERSDCETSYDILSPNKRTAP